MFAYTVTGEFDDAAVAAEWVSWLQHGHLDEVRAGGAREALLVQLAPLEFEVRYLFADAAAFAKYERESAPKLRAEGLAKFPPARGVRMSRSTGEVLTSLR
ncbi:MAG: DUF4286 family protein [Archangium sp.]|nr:DUF4286 family protein [Archangium sp.]